MTLQDRVPAAPLTRRPTMVVVSDRIDWHRHAPVPDDGGSADWHAAAAGQRPWPGAGAGMPEVVGGYLERLPLACIAAGLVEQAEVWHHQRFGPRVPVAKTGPHLGYRAFLLDEATPPFTNADMLAFVQVFGAPHLLVVYGLGVSAALLDACANSFIIYNSIDAPTLRVPPEVSARFDLV